MADGGDGTTPTPAPGAPFWLKGQAGAVIGGAVATVGFNRLYVSTLWEMFCRSSRRCEEGGCKDRREARRALSSMCTGISSVVLSSPGGSGEGATLTETEPLSLLGSRDERAERKSAPAAPNRPN